MKIWKHKFLKQMIIVITLLFVIFNCIIPPKVYATKSQEGLLDKIGDGLLGVVKFAIPISSTTIEGETDYGLDQIPGNLLKDLMYLIVALGDIMEATMQVTLLGDYHFWTSTMISNKNDNLGDSNSWLYADQGDINKLQEGNTADARGSMLVVAKDAGLKAGFFTNWKVPNMLYSPENIFANKIAALDANYINPHEYTPVNNSQESQEEATSLAKSIRPTIASWYRAFRNIAIVSLLSILVYIGIRILIGTVSEKAKYKERLADWFIALCLVFFMHFIMAGIMMIAEQITNLLANSVNSGIIVAVDDGTIFRTSLMGYIRFAAQSNSWTEALGYGIMYLILVGITLRYTFIYLKRALYLAFFTMISPLVAITYPIDKAGDGKAQAFNIWIKEYFINAIIQPVHLVLYSALVGAAMALVVQNPIYGIVALLFISTAEKWIKKMFKIDQAVLTSTSLGDVAVLSGMLNIGKKMVGGVAKTAGLVGLTIATGGAAAPVAAAGGAAGAAAGGAETAGATAGGAETAGATTGGAEGAESEEIDLTSQQLELADYLHQKVASGELSNEQLSEDERSLIEQAKKVREKEKARQREKLVVNNSSVNANSNQNASGPQEKAPTPQAVGGQNIEDISGVNKEEKKSETSNEAKSPNEKTETSNEAKSPEEKYYKKQIQNALIKKITDKDPKEELIDMGIKGVTGLAGAVLGAPVGAFAAGLTGDSKSILAGAMGGAATGASVGEMAISTGDTIFNNNVKVLVKDGKLQDENIIRNTAAQGKQHHWSEAKMLEIGKLAEAYADLKNDKVSQDEIKKIMREKGVTSEKKLKKVVSDIISVQQEVKETTTKQNEKAQNKMKKWK